MKLRAIFFATCFISLFASGCKGDKDNNDTDDKTGFDVDGDGVDDYNADSGAVPGVTEPTFDTVLGADGRVRYFCADKDGDGKDDSCQCDDGIDNDGSRGIDMLDFTCISPWDDSEGAFGTGISGDNFALVKQDCFFDGNSGGGQEQCSYPTVCLCPDTDNNGKPGPCEIGGRTVKEAKCTAGEGSNSCKAYCAVDQGCLDTCMDKTPNGCDCFGCCAVTKANGVVSNFLLSPTCDPSTGENCTSCVQASSCLNACDTCEICIGKPSVPASCGGTGTPTCVGGTACTPETSTKVCGSGYCSLGCCVAREVS